MARLDEIGRALLPCHARGIVHGDVKPQNIVSTSEMLALASALIAVAEEAEPGTREP